MKIFQKLLLENKTTWAAAALSSAHKSLNKKDVNAYHHNMAAHHSHMQAHSLRMARRYKDTDLGAHYQILATKHENEAIKHSRRTD